MGKVTTNKKLELVRAIRMQNHYDRQLFRAREGLLYSDMADGRGELYGLENMDRAGDPMEKSLNGKGSIAGSFRIRFVIAMALLLFFILCDINQVSYQGQTTQSIFGQIVESPDLTELFKRT